MLIVLIDTRSRLGLIHKHVYLVVNEINLFKKSSIVRQKLFYIYVFLCTARIVHNSN